MMETAMTDMINTSRQSVTMSSREMADLCEKRHDSVKRTIDTLAEKGLIRFTQIVETSHEGAGARSVEVYRVGKRDSYVVVAQFLGKAIPTCRLRIGVYSTFPSWRAFQLGERNIAPVPPWSIISTPAAS
jgi:phage regulator Rha-like protein